MKTAAFLCSKATVYAKTLGVYGEKPHICGKKGFGRQKQHRDTASATVLKPVQQHRLKMFAFDGSEERLPEVKNVLGEYFRKKADACLDALWDSGFLIRNGLTSCAAGTCTIKVNGLEEAAPQ